MEALLGRVRKMPGNWNLYEIAWLSAFAAIAVVSCVADGDTPFGFTIFTSGVLCVLLAAKGNIATYAFGAYNTLGYAWIAYSAGLFGEMALNLFFYVPMNVVGFFMWRRRMRSPGQVSMRRLGAPQVAVLGCAVAAGIVAVGWGLAQIPGQATPCLDATTNVLSVAATLLMNARFREQWLCYIVLDGFTVAMWALRLLAGTPEALLMLVMWTAYLVNAFYGMYVWSCGSRSPAKGA